MQKPLDPGAISTVFHHWWSDLESNRLENNRAARARLRRLDLVSGPNGATPDVLGALMEPALRDLVKRINPHWCLHDLRDQRIEDLVVAASTLARIRIHSGQKAATLLGGPNDEVRKMKEGRFLSLMRCKTPADLLDQGRRIAALLDGTADVGDLGLSLMLWRTQPWVRRNWARDYYHIDLKGREGSAPVEAVS